MEQGHDPPVEPPARVVPTSPRARCYKCNRMNTYKSGLCVACWRKNYGPQYRKTCADMLREHVARGGWWCEGYADRGYHQVAEGDLECDHHRPVSRGGDSRPSNVRPLCRDCNIKKSNNRPQRI